MKTAIGATCTKLIIDDKSIPLRPPGRIISANGKSHHVGAPGLNTDNGVVRTETLDTMTIKVNSRHKTHPFSCSGVVTPESLLVTTCVDFNHDVPSLEVEPQLAFSYTKVYIPCKLITTSKGEVLQQNIVI